MMKIKIYKDGKLYAEFDADQWPEEWELVDDVSQGFLVEEEQSK